MVQVDRDGVVFRFAGGVHAAGRGVEGEEVDSLRLGGRWGVWVRRGVDEGGSGGAGGG